jgi:potassium-dependent mechanosensitive channel
MRSLLLILACLAIALPARAQAPAPASDPATDVALGKATADLQAAASGIRSPSTSDEALRARLAAIPSIQAELSQVLGQLTPRLADADARLAQLGPTPSAGQPPDAPATAAARTGLLHARQAIDADIKRANLLTVETSQTSKAISNQLRANVDARLLARSRSIFDPRLVSGLDDAIAKEAARVVVIFEQEGRHIGVAARGPRGGLILAFGALAAGFLIAPARLLLSRTRYWRSDSEGPESRLRQSARAVWLVLVATVTPLLAGLALRAALSSAGALDAEFDVVLLILIRVAAVTSLIEALGRELLAPGQPSWRLAPIPDDMAARLAPYPAVIGVAAGLALLVSAIDIAIGPGLATSAAGERITVAIEILAVGAALLAVMRHRGQREVRPQSSGGPLVVESRLLWVLTALAAWVALAVGLVAMLIGYVALAGFLMRETIWISTVLAILFLSLVFADEIFPALLSPKARLGRVLRNGVGIHDETLEHLAVLLSGLSRLGLLLFGWAAILLPFGTSAGDIVAQATSTQSQFKIGQATVSPGAVFGAIGLFLIALTITRAVRGWLEVRYLPKTRMDRGVRTSVSALFSYVGGAIAVLLAFAYLGLSFSQIALFASALSVGIGFGLQSIIGNFVSGLILLVERPVKVGDWIAIGDLEGDVRAINIRATEIDMWDKSKLIVPNSELVSKTVRNVTHAGALGRVKIVLRLDSEVDPAAVRDIVLGHLKAHPKILSAPGPGVFFTDIHDGALEFTAIAFVPSPRDAFGAKSELLFQIVPDLQANGIGPSKVGPVVNLAAPARPEKVAPRRTAKAAPRV